VLKWAKNEVLVQGIKWEFMYILVDGVIVIIHYENKVIDNEIIQLEVVCNGDNGESKDSTNPF